MESRLRLFRCCFLAIAFVQWPTPLFAEDGQPLPSEPPPPSPEPYPSTSPRPTTIVSTSQPPRSEGTSGEPPTQPPSTVAIGQWPSTVQESVGSLPYSAGSSATKLTTQNAGNGSGSPPSSQSNVEAAMTSMASTYTAEVTTSKSPVNLTDAISLARNVTSSAAHSDTTAVQSSPSPSHAPTTSFSSRSPSYTSASVLLSTSPFSPGSSSMSSPASSFSPTSSPFSVNSGVTPSQPGSSPSLAPAATSNQTSAPASGQSSPSSGPESYSTASVITSTALSGPTNELSLQWTSFGIPAALWSLSGFGYIGCWNWSSFWMAENTSFVYPANTTIINETQAAAEHCAASAKTSNQARFIAIDDNLNCFMSWNDSVFTAAPTDNVLMSTRKSCMKVYDLHRGYQPIGCWQLALRPGIDNITSYTKDIPNEPSLTAVTLQDACGLIAKLHGYTAFLTQSNISCFGTKDRQLLLSGWTNYLGTCSDSQKAMDVYFMDEGPVNADTQWSSWTSCSRGCGAGNTTRVRYRITNNNPVQQMEDAVCNERPCPWSTDSPRWDGCWSSVPAELVSMESMMLSPADKNPSTRQAAVEKCAVLSYARYSAFAVQGGQCLAIVTDNVQNLLKNATPSDACPTVNPYASKGYDVYVFSSEPPPGSWGVWSPFDSCTFACGTNGMYTRKRTCSNPPSAMGCPPGNPQQQDVQSCNVMQCPLRFNWAISMGCYNVPNDYVELSDPLLDGLPRTQRKDPFKKCAVVAFTRNFTVFGLTGGNLCWTGPQFYCQLNNTGTEMTNCLPNPSAQSIMEVYQFQRVTSAPQLSAAASTGNAFALGSSAAVVCSPSTPGPLSTLLTTSGTLSAPVAGPTETVVASTPCPTTSTQVEGSSLQTDALTSTSLVIPGQLTLPSTVLYNDAAAALNTAGLVATQLLSYNDTGKVLADFLSSLNAKLTLANASEASSFLQSFASTMSTFTATGMTALWKKAPRYGGLMLQSAEEVALYCGSMLNNMTVSAPNVVMQLISISSPQSGPATLTFESLSSAGPTSLTIPDGVLTTTAGTSLTVAAIQLENFTSALSSPNASNNSSILSGTLNGTLLPGVLSIRTNVIAPNTTLTSQVVIRMPYNSTSSGSNMNGTCVFWNVTSEQWSIDGCTTVAINSTVECHCNHLTSFAVLMRVDDYEPDGNTATALTYISYIGCGISVACLIATFGVLLYLNNLKTDKKTIHMNLVVSLGVAQVTHISGINLTSDSITCTVIAVMLHFFYSTAFFWMLCEGLHLYLKVVAVFNSENASKRIIYYLIGYVCPAVIVGISVGIRHDGYGNKNFCWLSTSDGLVWAFVGPVCAIILCNIIILCIVMKIVISTAATIPNKKKKDFQLVRTGVKGVMILMPLLGVSWLLGLLAVNSSTLVFEFLFVIINSTQGLFIFLFHCVGSSEVRGAFRRKRDQSSRSKDGKRSSVVQSTNDPNPNNNRTAKDGIAILVEDPRFPVLYLNNFQADGQKVPLTIESAIDGLLNGTLGLNVGGYKHAVPEDVDVVDINSYSKSALDVTEACDDEIDNDDIDEDIISAELAGASRDDLVGNCLRTVDRSTALGSREQTRLDMSNCERRSALSTGQLREASAQTRLGTARRVTSAGAERPTTAAISSPADKGTVLQAERTTSIQTSSGIGSSLSLDSSWEDEIIQSMLAERPLSAATNQPKPTEPRSRVGSANARLHDISRANKPNSDDSTKKEEAACVAKEALRSSSRHSGVSQACSPAASLSSTSLRSRSGKRSAKVSPSPMPIEDDEGRASTAVADDSRITPALQHPFRLTSVSASTNFVYTK